MSVSITAKIREGKVLKPKTPKGYVLNYIDQTSPPQYVYKKKEKSEKSRKSRKTKLPAEKSRKSKLSAEKSRKDSKCKLPAEKDKLPTEEKKDTSSCPFMSQGRVDLVIGQKPMDKQDKQESKQESKYDHDVLQKGGKTRYIFSPCCQSPSCDKWELEES